MLIPAMKIDFGIFLDIFGLSLHDRFFRIQVTSFSGATLESATVDWEIGLDVSGDERRKVCRDQIFLSGTCRGLGDFRFPP